MKKIILFLIPFLLCGCTNDMNRRELDEIDLVQILGIDFRDEEYTLSAFLGSGESGEEEDSEGSEQEEAASDILIGQGKTPYAAFEDMRTKNKKSLSLAHTGFYLIGDGAARHGIDVCIDFLSRDETIKMEAQFFITKDMEAQEFISESVENKQMLHEDLEAIRQKRLETLKRLDNTLVNLLNDLEQTKSSLIVPYLLSEDALLIDGYAVFDRNHLRDYLDNETSIGIDFMKNIVRRYPIYLENGVSLLITDSDIKMKSDVNDGSIIVTIHIDFETMVMEAVKEDGFTDDFMMELTRMQNEYVKAILEKPLQYSLDTNMDVLFIARIIENQHSRKWRTIEENWSEEIGEIKYRFDINSRVVKSFITENER